MITERTPRDIPRARRVRTLAWGCVPIVALFTVAGAVSAILWLIPNAPVSTLPPVDAPPDVPTPALLLHMTTSAPEIRTLLDESMGSEAMLIATMMPYEGTFTIRPKEDRTARAELRLSVPRSAAALQVLFRAAIDQPTPSGYVVRAVERPESSVIQVVLEGPLGQSTAPPPHPASSSDAGILDAKNPFSTITLHNEDGAWGRIVAGYLDSLPEGIVPPVLVDWSQFISAQLAAEFLSIDEILWHGIVRCTTADAATRLAQGIEDAMAQVRATDTSGLRYETEIKVLGTEIHGHVRLQGVRDAVHAAAQASHESH